MAQTGGSAAIKPVCFIYGTEEYLIEEAVADIKRRALAGGFESMNYSAYDAKSMDVTEALSTAETLPAFSDYRVVLVREAASLKAEQQKVISGYVESPSPTTCLVLVAGTAKVNKNTALFKLLTKKGYVRVCNRLKDAELVAWMVRRARSLGKGMTKDAAARLLTVAGTALMDIEGELEKIVLYAGDKETVEVGDVEDAGLDCREETVFSLSDAIGRKDLDAAMRIYEKVSTETPVNLLGAVARQMRVLLKLKSLVGAGMPARALPPKLGVSPYHLDGYVQRSRHFTEAELKRAIFRLSEADVGLKTGKLPPALVMTSLIIDLCRGRGGVRA